MVDLHFSPRVQRFNLRLASPNTAVSSWRPFTATEFVLRLTFSVLDLILPLQALRLSIATVPSVALGVENL